MASPPDVLIAGGGPVGLLLALALRRAPLHVGIAAGDAPAADRPIALAYGTLLLLERLGISITGTPIRMIHVSQRGGFGRTLIRATDFGVPQLGSVVSYSELVGALRLRLASDSESSAGCRTEFAAVLDWTETADGVDVRHADGKLCHVKLLALADGGGAAARISRDYDQHAVVAHVTVDRPHGGTAYERFTVSGPIALLPDGDGFALVWSTARDEAARLCATDEREFIERLGDAFGTRVGRFTACSPRSRFPLLLRHGVATGRHVLGIGNAAQTLHPVAGQGLNLGLRDAWELAELATAHAGEIGSASFARRFTRRRTLDRRGGIGFTDSLVRVFSSPGRALGAGRGAGLLALDLLAPGRAFIARRMMFGARGLP